ncbi:hypothetical protein [Myroides sp. LJL110]
MQKNSSDSILKDLKKKEENSGLYNYEINKIPVFRVIRFYYRVNYMNKITGYINKSVVNDRRVLDLFYTVFYSFISVILLMFKDKNSVVFFSFPRLNVVEGNYLDKFVDPIVDRFEDSNFLIFQKSLGGKIQKPRYNSRKVSYIDFFTFISLLLAIIFVPFFYFKNNRTIKNLCCSIKEVYGLNKVNSLIVSIKLFSFFIEKKIYSILFSYLKVTSIVVVNRMVFYPSVIAAKEKGICVSELQHGITLTETTLYTGDYDERVDVDYFMCFGEVWKNTFFGMELNRIINIGWAYKDYMKKYFNRDCVLSNSVLLISHPAITNKLISYIANSNKILGDNIVFELRLHPQEQLNKEQLRIVESLDNVVISDRNEDSFLALLRHKYIVGDNSTVMYEALSLGKKVGKLNFGEFVDNDVERFIDFNFYNIKDYEDLLCYLDVVESSFNIVEDSAGVYDDFNDNLFNKIVLKYK